MKIIKLISAIAIASLILTSCASRPDKVKAAYVSPTIYQDFTCEQLAEEARRVSDQAVQATGAQKKRAQSDAVAVGIGIVLFWPALFFIKGNNVNESELARLKGTMETIENVATQKQCGFEFRS